MNSNPFDPRTPKAMSKLSHDYPAAYYDDLMTLVTRYGTGDMHLLEDLDKLFKKYRRKALKAVKQGEIKANRIWYTHSGELENKDGYQ